jgi:hypothetical protein
MLLSAPPELMEVNFDVIIFDEAQMLRDYKAQRSRRCSGLVAANPDAIRLALTGTPIDVSPADLFQLLQLVRPGGMGFFAKFRDRYLTTATNDFGYKEITGVQEENLQEFRERVGFLSHRLTKAEIAPWLPRLCVYPIYVSAESSLTELAVAWRKELVDAGERGPAVAVAYKRASAQALAVAVGGAYIDGEISLAKRDAIIAEVSANAGILSATIKSIGVGRDDLVGFKHVLITEIYPVPGVMEQLLGRWHRLSSNIEPTSISIVVREGVDELAVGRLLYRLQDASAFETPGAGAEALTALEREYSPEALAQMFSEE